MCYPHGLGHTGYGFFRKKNDYSKMKLKGIPSVLIGFEFWYQNHGASKSKIMCQQLNTVIDNKKGIDNPYGFHQAKNLFVFFVKFMFSKKATKIEKIFTGDLTLTQ